MSATVIGGQSIAGQNPSLSSENRPTVAHSGSPISRRRAKHARGEQQHKADLFDHLVGAVIQIIGKVRGGSRLNGSLN